MADHPVKSESHELPPVLRMALALWRGRRLVALCTLACVAAAALVTFFLPRTYEATAGLLLIPSPVKSMQGEDSDVAKLFPKMLAVADYEILLHSDGILMRAVEALKGSKNFTPDELEQLSQLSTLRSCMEVEVEITQKTAYAAQRSPVILLHASARTPEQARDLAAAWAKTTEEISMEISKEAKSGSMDFLTEKFDHSDKALNGVYSQLRDLEMQYNDELEEARLQHMHGRVLGYEDKLIELSMQKTALQKEIELLKEKLAATPERITLWESAPMESVFMQDALGKDSKGGLGEEHRKKGYASEHINTLWEHLRDKLSGQEITLHGVETSEREIRLVKEKAETDLNEQRALVATKKYERNLVGQRVTPYKSSFDKLAEKLEEAKIAEAEEKKLSDVKLVSPPVAPDRPIRPLRAVIVAAAASLGLLVAASAVLLKAEVDRLLAAS